MVLQSDTALLLEAITGLFPSQRYDGFMYRAWDLMCLFWNKGCKKVQSLSVTSQGTWTVSMGALSKAQSHCSREHQLQTHFSCSLPDRNLEKLGCVVWDGCGISCAMAQLGQGRQGQWQSPLHDQHRGQRFLTSEVKPNYKLGESMKVLATCTQTNPQRPTSV